MTAAVGMLEALTSAIGESDGEIGGIPFTRLTAPVTDGVALSATYTWDGTTTILCGDTSEIAVGDWIRLDVDGQYFEVTGETPDTSITIDNPQSLIIPTGSSQSSKAVTTLPVESTLDFSEDSKVSIDGAVYYYTGKTDQSFTGIYHLVGGVSIAGVQRLHRVESVVYDRNRDRSAIDLVRRAMLVDYAEGEDLNALARNLGVLRLAFLSDDDQFREIVKVLAYNPKGTLYGLQLALEGLVGAGNFTIYEDPINFPAEVFITLSAAAFLATVPQGSAYLSGGELVDWDSLTQVTVAYPAASYGAVRHVRMAPLSHVTDTTSAYPSTDQYERYPGSGLSNFYTTTGTEGTTVQIVTTDGGALEFTNGPMAVNYAYYGRQHTSTRGSISMWLRMLDNGSGVPEAQPAARINWGDGQYMVRFVWTQNGTGGSASWDIGFGDWSGAFGITPPNIPIDNAWHELRLERSGDGYISWYWDGVLQQRFATSYWNPHTTEAIGFGYSLTPTSAASWRMKEFRIDTVQLRDFYAATLTDGVVAAASRTLTTSGFTFLSADVGKGFSTLNSAVVNAYGGNNNGRWLVEAQGGTTVTLIGETWTGALVQGAFPTRITLPLDQPLLKYPDDQGKEIEILGSGPNAGIYVIDDLLDPVTGTPIDSAATPLPQKTHLCTVVGATFASETDLSFRLRPNFAAESGLEWILQEAGSMSGQVITMRQGFPNIPNNGKAAEVIYGSVLSAQLLRNADVENALGASGFDYWPFYLADPLGYARTYLSGVTAAGVIPSFDLD
ncbi:MAG: hypothetical protein JSU89_15710 [Myxococcales bacterium]|nr:MAG: hypothetical protein JSU89_15710 [Myxococcales bacterium]